MFGSVQSWQTWPPYPHDTGSAPATHTAVFGSQQPEQVDGPHGVVTSWQMPPPAAEGRHFSPLCTHCWQTVPAEPHAIGSEPGKQLPEEGSQQPYAQLEGPQVGVTVTHRYEFGSHCAPKELQF